MLSLGFCGSLTTFSGWQLDVFNSWINTAQFDRGGLRDVRTVFLTHNLSTYPSSSLMELQNLSLRLRYHSLLSPLGSNLPLSLLHASQQYPRPAEPSNTDLPPSPFSATALYFLLTFFCLPISAIKPPPLSYLHFQEH